MRKIIVYIATSADGFIPLRIRHVHAIAETYHLPGRVTFSFTGERVANELRVVPLPF
jgi:hypothetical protein